MRTMLMLSILLIVTQGVSADDLRFETTEEGIVNALTSAIHEKEIKTRSLKRSAQPKMRSIRVVGKEDGEMIEKTISVPENSSGNGVWS